MLANLLALRCSCSALLSIHTPELWAAPQAASLSPHRFVMDKWQTVVFIMVYEDYDQAFIKHQVVFLTQIPQVRLPGHPISVRLPQAHLSPHGQLRAALALSGDPSSAAQVAFRDWFWVSVCVASNNWKEEALICLSATSRHSSDWLPVDLSMRASSGLSASSSSHCLGEGEQRLRSDKREIQPKVGGMEKKAWKPVSHLAQSCKKGNCPLMEDLWLWVWGSRSRTTSKGYAGLVGRAMWTPTAWWRHCYVSHWTHLGKCLSPSRVVLAEKQPPAHFVPVVQVANGSCKLGKPFWFRGKTVLGQTVLLQRQGLSWAGNITTQCVLISGVPSPQLCPKCSGAHSSPLGITPLCSPA